MHARLGLICALLGVFSGAQARDIGELVPLSVFLLGRTADWVAIGPDAVWVGATGPYAVHRIDPASNARTATALLPGEPCAGLALGFGALWVPLCASKPADQAGLARVSLATGRLEALYPVRPAAAEGGVAVAADSVWLVIDRKGTLARIDPSNGTVRARIHIAPGSFNPHGAAGTLYVTQADGTGVTVIDASTGRARVIGEAGAHPRFLTSGDGAVWTLNQGDGSVSRLDLKSDTVERIALDTPGHGGDIAFDEGRVWSTMPQTPLSVIDAASRRVLCQWRGPGGDSLGLGFGSIWLTDYHRGTLTRLDVADAMQRCGR